MSKILAVADIHINDYANRNPSNKFRLYQGSRTVADNIIKAGKDNNCDIIVFAGDIVEKCIIRPYIQAEVKYFLDTIMSNFKEGYIIWGNHDIDGKSVDQDISDACLGVMLPNNLFYANKRIINIDGNLIGFCNWMPKFDLSWIQNKVDILITHATICYNKSPKEGRVFESQELDESKFDLAICGDIHQRGQIGKYVSIGCCQRCKMSDPEESTGIVIDCINKKWEWINLNPDDNLMKFSITKNLDEEGWDESSHTWKVYKQEISLLDPITGNIKVDAWEEINSLVENTITSAGLLPTHYEVINNISNVDSGEVDFNFTIIHLHCENWRSIKEIDVDFQDMDKILILGSNGSGKSSLLSAIKYSLCDVSDSVGISSLKSFTTFREKDCLTEITFLYQGNLCKIQRGTSKYGLWINNDQMKYNSKRLFEKDVRERFPFIKYMDAFFFDADKSSFLRSLSPERITEITSKFLKLNRIETYNETARSLFDQIKLGSSDWVNKFNEAEKLITYLDEKLSNITLPNISKEDLEKYKQEGLSIQEKNSIWLKYLAQSSSIRANISLYSEKITELNDRVSLAKNQDVLDTEIKQLNSQLKSYQERLSDLNSIKINISYKEKELNNLKEEGNNYWIEARDLSKNKVCPTCGKVIDNTADLENHRLELLEKVEKMRPIINKLSKELNELKSTSDNLDNELSYINQKMEEITSEISKKYSEKESNKNDINNLKKYRQLLRDLEANLQDLGNVEQVDLPKNFMETMSNIERGINSWKLYENTKADKDRACSDLQNYRDILDNVNEKLLNLEAYIKLTGSTGIIFEEIFNKLSKQFSSNLIKYEVERRGKGRLEKLSLVPNYNNSGNLVPISLCSSGQRTLLDIDYLSKIIDRLGLLVLDEFFKNLDNDRLEEVLDILKSMNVGCIMLTSHAESIPAFNNKTYIMTLNESGITETLVR